MRVFRRNAPRLRDLLAFQVAPPALEALPLGRLDSPPPGAPSPSAIVPVPYSRLPGYRLRAPFLGDSLDEVYLPSMPPEAVPEIDLNQLELEALRRRVQQRDGYARLVLPDADTTDAESTNRRRARLVVYRAIDAMGGMDALLALKEMHVRVWIVSSEHRLPDHTYVSLPPYAYPVSRWDFRERDEASWEQVQVAISTDPGKPNPPYVFRNPARDLWAYDLLFPNLWALVLSGMPSRLRDQREAGWAARWHFVDRFLGAGVELAYIGRERYGRRLADVIRVSDRPYGFFFEAFFDTHTALLVGTREGLSPWEQQLFRDLCRRQGSGPCRPPVWETTYADYNKVQGVLTAHRMRRRIYPPSLLRPSSSTVLLKVAYNADELDDAAPDVP